MIVMTVPVVMSVLTALVVVVVLFVTIVLSVLSVSVVLFVVVVLFVTIVPVVMSVLTALVVLFVMIVLSVIIIVHRTGDTASIPTSQHTFLLWESVFFYDHKTKKGGGTAMLIDKRISQTEDKSILKCSLCGKLQACQCHLTLPEYTRKRKNTVIEIEITVQPETEEKVAEKATTVHPETTEEKVAEKATEKVQCECSRGLQIAYKHDFVGLICSTCGCLN